MNKVKILMTILIFSIIFNINSFAMIQVIDDEWSSISYESLKPAIEGSRKTNVFGIGKSLDPFGPSRDNNFIDAIYVLEENAVIENYKKSGINYAADVLLDLKGKTEDNYSGNREFKVDLGTFRTLKDRKILNFSDVLSKLNSEAESEGLATYSESSTLVISAKEGLLDIVSVVPWSWENTNKDSYFEISNFRLNAKSGDDEEEREYKRLLFNITEIKEYIGKVTIDQENATTIDGSDLSNIYYSVDDSKIFYKNSNGEYVKIKELMADTSVSKGQKLLKVTLYKRVNDVTGLDLDESYIKILGRFSIHFKDINDYFKITTDDEKQEFMFLSYDKEKGPYIFDRYADILYKVTEDKEKEAIDFSKYKVLKIPKNGYIRIIINKLNESNQYNQKYERLINFWVKDDYTLKRAEKYDIQGAKEELEGKILGIIKAIAPFVIFISVVVLGFQFILFKKAPKERVQAMYGIVYIFIGALILASVTLFSGFVNKTINIIDSEIKVQQEMKVENNTQNSFFRKEYENNNIDISQNAFTDFTRSIITYIERDVLTYFVDKEVSLNRILFLRTKEGQKISPVEPFTPVMWQKLNELYKIFRQIVSVFVVFLIMKTGILYVVNAHSVEKRTQNKTDIKTWFIVIIGLYIFPYAFKMILQSLNYVTRAIPLPGGNLKSINDVRSYVTNTNWFTQLASDLTYLIIEINIYLVFLIRTIVISVAFAIAPVMIFLHGIKKKNNISKVWAGDLARGLLMQPIYAFTFYLAFLLINNLEGNWLFKITWIVVASTAANKLRNSIQNYFVKGQGIEEEAEAKKIKGKISGLFSKAIALKNRGKDYLGMEKGSMFKKIIKKGSKKLGRLITRILQFIISNIVGVALFLLALFLIWVVVKHTSQESVKFKMAEEILNEDLSTKKINSLETYEIKNWMKEEDRFTPLFENNKGEITKIMEEAGYPYNYKDIEKAIEFEEKSTKELEHYKVIEAEENEDDTEMLKEKVTVRVSNLNTYQEFETEEKSLSGGFPEENVYELQKDFKHEKVKTPSHTISTKQETISDYSYRVPWQFILGAAMQRNIDITGGILKENSDIDKVAENIVKKSNDALEDTGLSAKTEYFDEEDFLIDHENDKYYYIGPTEFDVNPDIDKQLEKLDGFKIELTEAQKREIKETVENYLQENSEEIFWKEGLKRISLEIKVIKYPIDMKKRYTPIIGHKPIFGEPFIIKIKVMRTPEEIAAGASKYRTKSVNIGEKPEYYQPILGDEYKSFVGLQNPYAIHYKEGLEIDRKITKEKLMPDDEISLLHKRHDDSFNVFDSSYKIETDYSFKIEKEKEISRRIKEVSNLVRASQDQKDPISKITYQLGEMGTDEIVFEKEYKGKTYEKKYAPDAGHKKKYYDVSHDKATVITYNINRRLVEDREVSYNDDRSERFLAVMNYINENEIYNQEEVLKATLSEIFQKSITTFLNEVDNLIAGRQAIKEFAIINKSSTGDNISDKYTSEGRGYFESFVEKVNDEEGTSFGSSNYRIMRWDIPTVYNRGNGNFSRENFVVMALSVLELPYFHGGKHKEYGTNNKWSKNETISESGSKSQPRGSTERYGLDSAGYVEWLYIQLLGLNSDLLQGDWDTIEGIINSEETEKIDGTNLEIGDFAVRKTEEGYSRIAVYVGKDLDGNNLYALEAGAQSGMIVTHNLTETQEEFEGNQPIMFNEFYRLTDLEFLGDNFNKTYVVETYERQVETNKEVRSKILKSLIGDLAVEGFVWPVAPDENLYQITSGYKNRDGFKLQDGTWRSASWHHGIDINTNIGNAIIASKEGKVKYAKHFEGAGNTVIVDHADGYTTAYKHLNSFAVEPGDNVIKGQVVGGSGTTGWSTGPHLHFEVRDTKKRGVGKEKRPATYYQTLNPVNVIGENLPEQVKGEVYWGYNHSD